jgi:hypothetical protein
MGEGPQIGVVEHVVPVRQDEILHLDEMFSYLRDDRMVLVVWRNEIFELHQCWRWKIVIVIVGGM